MNSSVLSTIKENYFLYGLLVFLASFFILPTSKMVNNVYYVLLALPALFYIVKSKFVDFELNYSIGIWLAFLSVLIISGLLSSASLQYYKHILYVFIFLSICVFIIKGSFLFSDKLYRVSFWFVTLYVLLSAVVYWLTGRYGFGERVIWLPARMTGPIYTSMLISALYSMTVPVWFKNKNYLEMTAGFRNL